MKKSIFLLIMIVTIAWSKGLHQAKIEETMDSGGYTYMKVSEGGKNYWIAATKIAVKRGDTISFTQEMQMHNFKSKTLNRTFENIIFVSEVQGANNRKNSHKQQNIHVKNSLKENLKHTKVSPYKTKDSLAVAETYKKAKSLAGQRIKIRGKVTKVSPMIMGKNWVHIQDGTGDSHTDDIVFTSTKEMPKVGEIVTAEGVVAVDKDFGYGYFYPVIIEESHFSK
jgi:hypothetical protein